MAKASDFESEDWGFESLRGRILLINVMHFDVYWIYLIEIGNSLVTGEMDSDFSIFINELIKCQRVATNIQERITSLNPDYISISYICGYFLDDKPTNPISVHSPWQASLSHTTSEHVIGFWVSKQPSHIIWLFFLTHVPESTPQAPSHTEKRCRSNDCNEAYNIETFNLRNQKYRTRIES